MRIQPPAVSTTNVPTAALHAPCTVRLEMTIAPVAPAGTATANDSVSAVAARDGAVRARLPRRHRPRLTLRDPDRTHHHQRVPVPRVAGAPAPDRQRRGVRVVATKPLLAQHHAFAGAGLGSPRTSTEAASEAAGRCSARRDRPSRSSRRIETAPRRRRRASAAAARRAQATPVRAPPGPGAPHRRARCAVRTSVPRRARRGGSSAGPCPSSRLPEGSRSRGARAPRSRSRRSPRAPGAPARRAWRIRGPALQTLRPHTWRRTSASSRRVPSWPSESRVPDSAAPIPFTLRAPRMVRNSSLVSPGAPPPRRSRIGPRWLGVWIASQRAPWQVGRCEACRSAFLPR